MSPVTTPDEILRGLTELLRQHLAYTGPVRREMRLVEGLELDSLRLFTLAAEVENRFQVCLDEQDEARLETVGDLVDLIHRKRGW